MAGSTEDYVLDGVGAKEVGQCARDVLVAEDHLLGPNLNLIIISTRYVFYTGKLPNKITKNSQFVDETRDNVETRIVYVDKTAMAHSGLRRNQSGCHIIACFIGKMTH